MIGLASWIFFQSSKNHLLSTVISQQRVPHHPLVRLINICFKQFPPNRWQFMSRRLLFFYIFAAPSIPFILLFFLQIMKVETVHERGAKNKQKVSDKVPFYTNNENVIICLTKTKKVNRFKTFFAYLQSHLNNQPSARSLQNPNICKQI